MCSYISPTLFQHDFLLFFPFVSYSTFLMIIFIILTFLCSLLVPRCIKNATSSDGSLGSKNDEGCSEVWQVLRITGFIQWTTESWTYMTFSAYSWECVCSVDNDFRHPHFSCSLMASRNNTTSSDGSRGSKNDEACSKVCQHCVNCLAMRGRHSVCKHRDHCARTWRGRDTVLYHRTKSESVQELDTWHRQDKG